MARKKYMTATVKKLRLAYHMGKSEKRWNTVEECAKLLDDMAASTFTWQANGYIKDESVVAATLAKMERILGQEVTLPASEDQAPQETTTDAAESASKLIQELNDVYDEGIAIGSTGGCWDGESGCARVTGVPYSTLKSQRAHTGPLKRKKHVLRTIRILRRKIQEAGTPQTAQASAVKTHPVGDSLQHAAVLLIGVLQQIAALASRQTLQNVLGSLGGLLPPVLAGALRDSGATPTSGEDLTHNLQEGLLLILQGSAQSAPQSTHPQDVVASTFFDRVLSGVAELRDQNLNGVRFVLNARNFRRLHGKVTREEVDDTSLLIEELVRRFTIFAQLDDVGQRALVNQKLTEKIDRLYRTIEQSRDVCPTKAAEEIGKDRQTQSLFNTK